MSGDDIITDKKTRKPKTIVVWLKGIFPESQWVQHPTKFTKIEDAIGVVKEQPKDTNYRIFTELKFGTVQEVVTKKVTI